MNDRNAVEREVPEPLDPVKENELRKSRVRVRVTYGMSTAYGLGALGLITWLMWRGETDQAIAVFSGLASTTSAIIAFWFGSRGSTGQR